MTFIDCRRGTRYEGERERDIRAGFESAGILRCDRINSVRSNNATCYPSTSVFPITINPGWVQCRYPLTRPVLPADGVFR